MRKLDLGSVFADDSVEVWIAPQPNDPPPPRKVFFSLFIKGVPVKPI